eukprot:UC4_evm8s1308
MGIFFSRKIEASKPSWPWLDTNLSPSVRAQSLVSQLSVPDLVDQLITDTPSVSINGFDLPAYHWRNNVLHGLVDNGVSTQFPQATGLAATWNPDLLEEVGDVCGKEQRAKHNIATSYNNLRNPSPMDFGLDLWGPNIKRWGRGQETYGECPTLTSVLATRMIKGLQSSPGTTPSTRMKTIATPKHFDAYSVDKEPPRLEFDPNITESDLYQYYFPAFRAAVEAGAGSIMCSYNGINGAPMCMSPLIQSVLRDEMGFKGYVVTDSGAVDFMVSRFHKFKNTTVAAEASLNAGVDLNSGTCFKTLENSLASGAVNKTRLMEAATRLFTARVSLGLLDPPGFGPFDKLGPADIMSPQNMDVALRAAEESIVLLRNEDGKLPLKSETKSSTVGVIGPAADDVYRQLGNYYGCSNGTWGSVLPDCKISTYLESINKTVSEAKGKVLYSKGCDQESNYTGGIGEALDVARKSDIVLMFLGLRNCQGGQGVGGPNCESEGHDREHIELPGKQQDLLEAVASIGKPVVLILTAGGPLSTPWAAKHVPAILMVWYGGAMAADALVNTIWERGSAPSGKLPFAIVQSTSDLPEELDMNLSSPPGRTYRYFTGTPLYNFGFGLSYSRLEYSDLEVPDSISVSSDKTQKACCKIKNSGAIATRDVVQLYASRLTAVPSAKNVPNVQLVSFLKTDNIPAGGLTRVCLDIDLSKIRLYVDQKYEVQVGKLALYVGPSAPGRRGEYVGESELSKPLEARLNLVP